MRALPKFISWNKRFNAVGVAVSIAQDYQTIVWATLGEHVVCREQRRRCCAFDSPGLPNDSAGYPGLMDIVRGTTP